MIALSNGLPLVTLPNGQSVSFSKEWIITALQHTAELHGYKHWSMALPLADALLAYLRQELEENTVTISYLEKIICDLLTSLHYHEIAASFLLPDPPTTFSLLDLVREAGSGYELAFFQLLHKRLKKFATSQSRSLKIADLEPCLQSLSHRAKSRRHHFLRDEIVNYVRNYGGSAFLQHLPVRNHSLEIELS